MKRCAVYIDGGYVDSILRDSGRCLDYSKFIKRLSFNMDLLRAYYYTCMPYMSNPPTMQENVAAKKVGTFLRRLRMIEDVEVKLGRLQKITKGNTPKFRQKGVDILLGVDMARMSWSKQIETAVLVTSDSDFVHAVRSVKDVGVTVHLWYYGGTGRWNVHRSLLEAADRRTLITGEILDECRMQE